MIGNDVVCLDTVQAEENGKNPRFVEKILTSTEQCWLNQQTDRETAFWILWALKESCYKAHFKDNRKRSFSPKSYLCYLQASPQQANILVDGRPYSASWVISKGYLHAFCWLSPSRQSDVHFHVTALQGKTQAEKSQELRQQLIDHMSTQLSEPTSQLDLTYEEGIPFLHRLSDHKRLPIDLSLSHHGKWGAWAYSF